MLADVFTLFSIVFNYLFDYLVQLVEAISPLGINLFVLLILIFMVFRYLVTPFMR